MHMHVYRMYVMNYLSYQKPNRIHTRVFSTVLIVVEIEYYCSTDKLFHGESERLEYLNTGVYI